METDELTNGSCRALAGPEWKTSIDPKVCRMRNLASRACSYRWSFERLNGSSLDAGFSMDLAILITGISSSSLSIKCGLTREASQMISLTQSPASKKLFRGGRIAVCFGAFSVPSGALCYQRDIPECSTSMPAEARSTHIEVKTISFSQSARSNVFSSMYPSLSKLRPLGNSLISLRLTSFAPFLHSISNRAPSGRSYSGCPGSEVCSSASEACRNAASDVVSGKPATLNLSDGQLGSNSPIRDD